MTSKPPRTPAFVAPILSLLVTAVAAYGQTLDSQQQAFLTLINNYRAQNGAGALQVSATLQNSSQWMSNDMASKNYFSHTDSLGRDPATRMQAFGYPANVLVGENIAAGYSDAQNTFTLWQTECDPDQNGTCTYTHNQNMLNPSWKAIGIGRAYGANSTYQWYWTTDFGAVLDKPLTSTLTATSVLPNSGSGASQTFSAVYTDSNGGTDLQIVYLDLGTSPFAANSCIVGYAQGSNTLYLFNDASNAAGSMTAGSGGTLSNSQCTLSGSTGAGTASGNTLTVPFALTFHSTFTGAKNIYGLAQSYSGSNGGWQTLGTWTPGAAQPLSAVSITPNSGTGTAQVFKAVYADPNGASDLQVVYIDFGASLFTANSCIVAYVPSSNVLYLFNDASNATVSGTVTPGGGGTASNSQCKITGAGGVVTESGTSMTVPVAITFLSGFAGTKNIYGMAQNYAGANGGWQTLGTWTPATVALAAANVTPVNGSGLGPQTFSAVYTAPAGGSDLQVVYLDFGTSPFATHSCIVAYVPSSKALYLYSDTNSAPAPITAGTNSTLSNSQCTLSASGGAGVVSGTNLTVPIRITFAAGFAGAKNVYGLAQSYSGTQGGWQTLGTWNP